LKATLFTYFAQTLNCLGTVVIYVEGGGGRKIGGALGYFKLAKRGAIVIFWYKDKGDNMIQQDLQYKKSFQES